MKINEMVSVDYPGVTFEVHQIFPKDENGYFRAEGIWANKKDQLREFYGRGCSPTSAYQDLLLQLKWVMSNDQ